MYKSSRARNLTASTNTFNLHNYKILMQARLGGLYLIIWYLYLIHDLPFQFAVRLLSFSETNEDGGVQILAKSGWKPSWHSFGMFEILLTIMYTIDRTIWTDDILCKMLQDVVIKVLFWGCARNLFPYTCSFCTTISSKYVFSFLLVYQHIFVLFLFQEIEMSIIWCTGTIRFL